MGTSDPVAIPGWVRGSICAALLVAATAAFGLEPVPAREAVVNAVASRPIAPGTRIDARIRDDTELNERLLAVVTEELRRAGYTVDRERPALVLTVEARSVSFGSRDAEALGSLDYGSDLGRPSSVEGSTRPGVDARIRLWSSTRNSVLRPDRPRPPTGNMIQVEFDAYDQSNGWHAWRGTATVEDVWDDVFEVARTMVTPLVQTIGRSVQAEVHRLE